MHATATATKPDGRRTTEPCEQRRPPGRASGSARASRQSRDAGNRLAAALDSLLSLPALGEARRCLLSAASGEAVVLDELVSTIESDVALTIAVLREANSARRGAGGCETVLDAVELLRPRTIQALASRLGTFDF